MLYNIRRKKQWETLTKAVSETVKCIKLLALIVVRNVKFRSNLQKAEMFFAENVIGKEDQEDSNLILLGIT